MIVKNEMEQWIGCTLCGEMTELRRRTVQDQEKMLILVEALREDHADCERYAGDPRQAAIQRAFKVGIRREMERAKSRKVA